MRYRIGALLLALSLSAAAAQKMPWESDDAGDKKPQSVRFLYPEQVSIAANHDSIVEMHFKVNDGLHINSHTPREKYLIPTQLLVVEPQGVKIGPVDFPAGTEYSFAATPNDKLVVYTGEFVIKAHVKAQAGEHLIQGALRYQACDTNSCYPPRKAPVAIDVIAR